MNIGNQNKVIRKKNPTLVKKEERYPSLSLVKIVEIHIRKPEIK